MRAGTQIPTLRRKPVSRQASEELRGQCQLGNEHGAPGRTRIDNKVHWHERREQQCGNGMRVVLPPGGGQALPRTLVGEIRADNRCALGLKGWSSSIRSNAIRAGGSGEKTSRQRTRDQKNGRCHRRNAGSHKTQK